MLSLLSMNKQELESAIQAFSNEVQTQFQEFQRVIEFSSKFTLCDYLCVGFLLEQARKARCDIEEQTSR